MRARWWDEKQQYYRCCSPISKEVIKKALKMMPNGKVTGPNQIPIEIRKCLGEEGLKGFTELFKKVILWTAKMPIEWRFNTFVPFYKNKQDI